MVLPSRSKAWLFNLALWCVGVVFLAAALLKAIDVESFTQQLARYDLLPPTFLSAAAFSIIIAELVLGGCCLVGYAIRSALWGIILMLSLFVISTVWRWSALQGTDCNCFGTLFAGGPQAVLWHNAVLIPLTGLLLLIRRGGVHPAPFRWLRTSAGLIAVFALMFFAQPIAERSSALTIGEGEDQLRVLLSATCQSCAHSAAQVQELVSHIQSPAVRLFIGAQYEDQINDFLKNNQLDAAYTPLTFSQLAREVEQVPTVRLIQGGQVIKEWTAQVPSVEEVKQALSATTQTTILLNQN